MQNILFRADSSSTIGLGHIMRDLTLASQIQKALPSVKIYFASRELNGNINQTIRDAGFIHLHIIENTQEELETLLEHYAIDLLIIDHYEITLKQEQSLRKLCKLLVFDDTFAPHSADFVLNHSFIAKEKDYDYLKDTKVLAGEEYTLLHSSFFQQITTLKSPTRDLPHSFLITLGGSDPLALSWKIKKYLLTHYKGVQVHIVTSSSNKQLSYLQHVDKELILNEKNMAELMQKYECIITSASSSLLESFALKKPFIAVKCASNQESTIEVLKTFGLHNVLEEFRPATLKRALNCVQYQSQKIRKVLKRYNFREDGVVKEILSVTK